MNEIELENRLKSLETVQYAIWFHDIIYNPKSHDNEELSLEEFKKFQLESQSVQLNQISDDIQLMIISTKNHIKTSHDISMDLNYFLDMDLSILGTSTEQYQTYSESIRKEYIHIDIDKYRQGRSSILKGFIQHGINGLYRTPEFRDTYGQKSLENLQSEINKLTT
ncbi:putative HD phosphohydrolase family protein [Tieghemostelium lacteum]|uniref:Putative HD phosphohydrolase family protein n=1 Tax=Tieghemostelium lacteum TaxID=361077 RepID=A0A152A776_TIELA|nr:putative HD phosphohydrolase family protein [Tieghemostelium lacteum]|eukprot:KYR01907.1 putative HD phosphohydrolase family protein [Tieghemostelium lacteum]